MKQNPQKTELEKRIRGTASTVTNLATDKSEHSRKKITQKTLSQAINLNATLAANQTKRKIVGRHNQMTNQNTRYASPAFRGNSGREGIHHRCIRTNCNLI